MADTRQFYGDGRIVIEAPPKKASAGDYSDMPPVDWRLPQFPFFVGVIGPRHTGKTVWLYNMLKNQEGFYGASFKKSNIVFFSPTAGDDETLKQLKLPQMFGPPTNPAVIVGDTMQKQIQLKVANNQTGVLLVFDDITQCKDAWPSIENLSYFGRHQKINVLYVAHKMSSIPRGVRTQTQQWILFKPHEESEFQWILDMFSRKRTKELWSAALARAWSQKYNFVYVDFEREEFEEIYRSGFDDCLFTEQEKAFILNTNMDTMKAMKVTDTSPLKFLKDSTQSQLGMNKSELRKKKKEEE